MSGYDETFLGEAFHVPLPRFAPQIEGLVLESPLLREGRYADYVNYTVAMHREHRTLLFAALNVDQTRLKTTERGDRWRIDSRIGDAFQLDNDYYARNPWDRGHMARRQTAAWGDTQKEAQRADDATFFFSNATLQHRNLNQDEWLALEDWVLNLDLDRTDRLCSFSGPVFGDFMRSLKPEGRPRAVIPSAFFKVVFFVNRQNSLEVRAFLLMQDDAALADRRGRKMFNYQKYQVSVREIEELTGLDFPDIVPETNPLRFTPDATAARDLNISHFPERLEVDGPDDIHRDADGARRCLFADDDVDVFIAGAMIDPKGEERAGEWVSILNLEPRAIDLDGWTLSDGKRTPLALEGRIQPGEAIRVQPIDQLQLANAGGVIQLFDDAARQIDRIRYTGEEVRMTREGRPLVFAYRDMEYALEMARRRKDGGPTAPA